MKIERCVTDSTGTPLTVAHIVMSPTPTETEVDLERDLVFFVHTYAKLRRSAGQESWDAFFDLTNKFLAGLPPEVQTRLYQFYEVSKAAIRGVTADNYDRVINMIADDLQKTVRQTDLPRLTLDFIESQSLLFPDLSGIGLRPHDRTWLTFHLPEYRILTAISLVCKLMCPVWGDFIFHTSVYIKTSDKEAHCLTMFLAVLESPVFSTVHRKLEGYMQNSIASIMKRHQNYRSGGDGYDLAFTLAHSGFGPDRFAQQVYGMLCVKKLALYDPIPEVQFDGKLVARNIMKYVAASIRATINTTVMVLQKESDTMVRRDPRDSTMTDNDSATVLENESHVSRVSADVPIVVEFGVNLTIDRLLSENRFPRQLFEDAMAYYRRSPPQMNAYVKTILSTFIGKELGGASTLRYLTFEPVARLITLIQFYMAKSAGSTQLLHLLSSHTPAKKRTEMVSIVDQRICFTFESSVEYRRLLGIYPLSLGPYKSIKQQVLDNVVFITEYSHVYNTAPAVVQFLDDEIAVTNGTPFVYDDNIVRELCTFLAQHSAGDAPEALT